MANLTGASDMWKTWAWWKNFNLTRKIKALIPNKYNRVNVRHRAFKCWLAQTSGFVLLATVANLNLHFTFTVIFVNINATIHAAKHRRARLLYYSWLKRYEEA